jgi:hypothetical protein
VNLTPFDEQSIKKILSYGIVKETKKRLGCADPEKK